MAAPLKPWQSNRLQNNGQILRNYNGAQIGNPRSVPVLPPRPPNSYAMNNTYNSYQPYSSYGGLGYGYGSYDMPYRNSMYNSYGTYGGYGMYNTGSFPSYNSDDAERRFIQFAEERSRNTFANVESIVRAFSSLAMMLDNTFFAMTSSFRAVLSVAENFGRIRNMFGHIWYSINIFRLINWMYKKCLQAMGYKVPQSAKNLAWNEAVSGAAAEAPGTSGGSSWPTLAFFGVLMSAPYFISKLLPKYEDKSKPENWKSSGIRAKGAFDFVATSSNELSIQINDEVLLAPKYIQDEMKLTNTGWAFAVSNGRSGIVPLNYVVLNKNTKNKHIPYPNCHEEIPVPKYKNLPLKSSLKKVTFGENQIFTDTSDLRNDLPIINNNNNENCGVKEESENIANSEVTNVEQVTITSKENSNISNEMVSTGVNKASETHSTESNTKSESTS